MQRICQVLALSAVLAEIVNAEYDKKAIPIKELWGLDAVPKNCYEVLPAYGTVENGFSVSDWTALQNTSIMSLDHQIFRFKRCFPYNKEEL